MAAIRVAAFTFFSLAVSITAGSSYNMVPDNLNFHIPRFDSDTWDLELRNASSMMGTGLELTVVPTVWIDLVGRAMYPNPMRLWDSVTGNSASFVTGFTFSIDSSNNTQFADGLAFFLAPNGSYDPPNNSHGGYLGLMNENQMNGTLPPSAAFVAVEVDTFYNRSNPWDPLCLHIGINVKNISSVNYTCVDWLDGKVETGGLINASITYDSSTGNLSAVLTDVDDPRNNSTVSHVIELKQYLPEEVIVGFTAATGTFSESHTIHSWDFRSNILVAAPDTKRNKATAVVVSIVGGVLLVGLVLGLAWRRFRSRKEKEDEDDDMMSIDREFGEVLGPKRFSYEDRRGRSHVGLTHPLLQERG